MAAYRSFQSASVTPRHSPKVSEVVSKALLVASFEPGAMILAAIIARQRWRLTDGLASMSRSRPRFLMVPSTAATWPWGTERTMSKFSVVMFEMFLSSARIFVITHGGSFERLARVLFLHFP